MIFVYELYIMNIVCVDEFDDEQNILKCLDIITVTLRKTRLYYNLVTSTFKNKQYHRRLVVKLI